MCKMYVWVCETIALEGNLINANRYHTKVTIGFMKLTLLLLLVEFTYLFDSHSKSFCKYIRYQ